MRLRHVLLLACAVGACGALLLAADMYRRLKEAESAALLSTVSAGSQAGRNVLLSGSTQGDGAVLNFLAAHALGLVSLAFLFLATFLLLIAALRDRTFAAAVDGAPPPAPGAPPAADAVPLVSLSELAATEPTVEEPQPAEAPPPEQAQTAGTGAEGAPVAPASRRQ
ncbi:MAG: hypothetical protein NTW87_03645 [Planctomycetota bacterium]|nr:hypothetical protein [Planctomycetota bacterium]